MALWKLSHPSILKKPVVFWNPVFAKFYTLMKKTVFLKFPKLHVNHGKTGFTFSQATPSHNFASPHQCVALNTSDVFILCFFFSVLTVCLWSYRVVFIVCYFLTFFFLTLKMLLRIYRSTLYCLSLCMPILKIWMSWNFTCI